MAKIACIIVQAEDNNWFKQYLLERPNTYSGTSTVLSLASQSIVSLGIT